MSFYWYIDIEESTYSQMNELDPPEMNAGPRGTFSVGPIEFADDEVVSVLALVHRVNTAFKGAFESGLSPNRYYMEARVRPMATGINGAISVADAAKIQIAKQRRELAIEYRIFNTDNVGFALQFRSGEHGSVSGLQLAPDGIPAAEVSVQNVSDVVAFATPYCSMEGAIMDKPPIPPDMVFVPYVGVNNKVMVLFNSNAGEKKERPIALRDGDMSFILDEYFAQHHIQVTAADITSDASLQKLQYRNDDPIRQYELFRIDSQPTSYDSFRNFNVTEFPIEAELGPDKFSTAVAYVDTIVPNKKYWYCARSIDIHSNISNPSYIFELEMVDDRGRMFLRQRIITFQPQKLNYKKTGRKILAIEPGFAQRSYDSSLESPGTVNINEAPTSNILGSPEVRQVSSVWGKKFKVRVTSKKTGRKIDLNIAFKNTGVVIP